MSDIIHYDPQAQLHVRVSEVTYRSDSDGSWPARLYQPEGSGPFPAILDVHGGAWNRGNYLDNERIDQALAASGLVVVAISCRQAPQYPYPAQVADVNYAIRWLKTQARSLQIEPRLLGAVGTSSGGHTLMLSLMRPYDPRYVLPLAGAADVDATLPFAIAAWPVLDSYARYVYAKENNRGPLVEATEAYFLTVAAMQEGNPQMALERGEKVELPPTLVIQGTADDNVPLTVAHRFVDAYRAAGGAIELELFPNMPHGFARTPGAEADRAIALMKGFIARQLAALQAAV